MRIVDLIACFQDTFSKSNNDSLKQHTAQAVQSNRVYKEGFICQHRPNVSACFDVSFSQQIRCENPPTHNVFDRFHNKAATQNPTPNENATIKVISGTTFDTAKRYCTIGKVAVLNFANPVNPGGGVQRGAMAQEECLCRSSNLYTCISDPNVFDEYYGYHRNCNSDFFTDRLIYTKNVTVFKDDSSVPQMLPQNEWFDVDVITCAAPYLGNRNNTDKAALKALFKNRIKNIFETALYNDVAVMILGAFGCGAFKNPPDLVASAFHEVIMENTYDKFFRKIVFAIKSSTNNAPWGACPNIVAFELEFFGLSPELNKER